MNARPVTWCEKLITVQDTEIPSWWLGILDPDGPGLFAGGGRLTVVAEAQALAAALEARRQGFKPVLFCASAGVRDRLQAALWEQKRRFPLLVRGHDDAGMRYLLHHPSKEVLLAWTRKRPLLFPTQAYREALEQWVAGDPLCRTAQDRLDKNDIRPSDFHLVSEPDGETASVVQRYEFEWALDPARRLTLYLYLTFHEAILAQTLAEKPNRTPVQLDDTRLEFDQHGEVELDGRTLNWMVDRFDLPETYRLWDDPVYGPGVTLPQSHRYAWA